MSSTVVRAAYVGNNVTNILQTFAYNDSTPTYIWYATRKQPLPTGEFASVATRPYDQQVYGNVSGYRTTGFTNHNGFQVELERRYNKGLAFQVFWVTGKTLAATGSVSDPNNFLPGAVPAEVDARNRFLNYAVDTVTPKHQIRWNWIADVPMGRGKRFAGNARPLLDKLIVGWQIASFGNLGTQ